MQKSTSLLTAAMFGALCATAPLSTASAESAIKPTFDTLFEPLVADPMEPRIAVMPMLGKKKLQLDIGTSADLYQNDSKTFAVGIDFATWSLLNRTSNFKFPVDCIDYMFGINTTFRQQIKDSALPFDEASVRVRLSHISAHFEDGHTDDNGDWLHPEESPFGIPFTYSREFVNVTGALSAPGRRVYLGYQYLYHTLPDKISPSSFQAGVEIGLPANAYVAADFKLLPKWDWNEGKTDGYRGTWNLQAGMRLTSIGLKNVRVAANYFSGMSRHGMYFYKPESFTTLGMIVDL
ncbi:DUF1207 domain-containing protein [Chlorobaculum sp. MV4-Y]|uniref:DUF1207 domain-containing protein n=1 Tax=Chlorobaculum sp. MV4-Y TaxID=2976335 RepID=UPI0021AFD1D3|nr:DUF1207 domain-containing protein [Chlorobaculum sp. MV4-Y]UWX57209.1 DUF1207 domain-containing protein [Chlorobaculum sp. MV4-Y]